MLADSDSFDLRGEIVTVFERADGALNPTVFFALTVNETVTVALRDGRTLMIAD